VQKQCAFSEREYKQIDLACQLNTGTSEIIRIREVRWD
jgi:hypothetical protein